ncbi:MAG: hypothetical protein ACOX8X_00610 [Methanomethylophilus sp.]
MSEGKQDRCAWCNKPCAGEFCSDGCRRRYDGFRTGERMIGRPFVFGFLALICALVLICIKLHVFLIGIVIAALIVFAFVMLFPFPAEKEVRQWGAERALMSVRVLDVLMLAAVGGYAAVITFA